MEEAYMFVEKKDKIEEMKTAYDKIPVPDLAQARVLAGIQKAKSEKSGNVVYRVMKGGGMGLVAAMLTITVMVNTNQTIANAMEQIPVIGAFAKVVTFRTYEDHSQGGEAVIEIPKIQQEGAESGTFAVNKSIEEYAQSLISQYETEIKNHQTDGHYQLTSFYEIVTDDSRYLSIRINTTEVMASGAQYVKIFTINKATGDIVTLKELFPDRPGYISEISENIKAQMREQMAADDSKLYFLDSEYPETDFNEITGDESFYFNGDGKLVIVFDEYQVAPGYMGVVEFVVDLT